MRRQNETFRRSPAARSASCCRRCVRDPALLVWLDAPANRKGHPNENLARELMELFTLGVGHYTEADVKEAARALTGWTGPSDAPVPSEVARHGHDEGEKTVLGQTGKWTRRRPGRRSCWNSPATARRLAWRLCEHVHGRGGRATTPRSTSWPTACASTTWTSAGRSRRSCGRGRSSPTPTWARASPARSSSSSRRRGRWRCSTRRRARWCWPSGPRGWARTCSIRPTSAAGRAAGRGSRPAAMIAPGQLRRGPGRRASCRPDRSR